MHPKFQYHCVQVTAIDIRRTYHQYRRPYTAKEGHLAAFPQIQFPLLMQGHAVSSPCTTQLRPQALKQSTTVLDC